MPIAIIPFRSPEPYTLPPMITSEIDYQSLEKAANQIIQLTIDTQCADLAWIEWLSEGTIVHGPWEGAQPWAKGFWNQYSEESRTADPSGRLTSKLDAPTMLMGSMDESDRSLFHSTFPDYIAQGASHGNVGFLYAYPFTTQSGTKGALYFHRWLESTPMNHDQPAIAIAIAQLLNQVG